MASLAIVSPGYPEMQGGVTDHTRRVLSHWESAGHYVLIIPEASPSEATLARLSEADGVLIQYVPFLYSRKGLSRAPQLYAKAARRSAAFIHETWVPRTRLPWLVLSPLQRRRTIALTKMVDHSVTPVPAWADMLPATRVLRVGSTIPGTDSVGKAGGGGIGLFSPFAAGLNWDWVLKALRDNDLNDSFTVVGASHEQALAHPGVSRIMHPGWKWTGYLPDDMVSDTLASFDLVLAPFIDGLTGRRTSAMATLQVGTSLVSSQGHLADPLFEQVVPMAADAAQFSQIVGERVRKPYDESERSRLREWFSSNLDSRNLDLELLGMLTGDN